MQNRREMKKNLQNKKRLSLPRVSLYSIVMRIANGYTALTLSSCSIRESRQKTGRNVSLASMFPRQVTTPRAAGMNSGDNGKSWSSPSVRSRVGRTMERERECRDVLVSRYAGGTLDPRSRRYAEVRSQEEGVEGVPV